MKRVDFYVYPAILTYDEGYDIAVTFPDFPGCATSGRDEADAIASAKEALSLHLYGMEQDGDDIPEPSAIAEIQKELEPNECIILVRGMNHNNA